MMTEEQVREYRQAAIGAVLAAKAEYERISAEGDMLKAIDAFWVYKLAVGELCGVCCILGEDPPSDIM